MYCYFDELTREEYFLFSLFLYQVIRKYTKQLRVKNNQLLKEEAAKDAALQALQKLVASRKAFRKQIGGSIAFAFAVGAVCGVWWKTGNS